MAPNKNRKRAVSETNGVNRVSKQIENPESGDSDDSSELGLEVRI